MRSINHLRNIIFCCISNIKHYIGGVPNPAASAAALHLAPGYPSRIRVESESLAGRFRLISESAAAQPGLVLALTLVTRAGPSRPLTRSGGGTGSGVGTRPSRRPMPPMAASNRVLLANSDQGKWRVACPNARHVMEAVCRHGRGCVTK